MAVVESSLHKAQSLFDNKNFAGALEHADEALKADPNSVSAHYWAGKASFCLGNIKRGKAEYKLAIVQDSSSLAAWEGLAELQMANGEVGEAQQTFEQLLNLAVKNGNILKQREYLWRSAEAADRLGDFSEAEEHLKQLQEMDLTKEQYIESLCLLADIQVKIEEQRMEQNVHQQIAAQERNPSHLVRSVTSIRLGVDAERADEQESEEGLADTLKAIVKRTAPNPIYSKYHAQHLQRFLSKMGAYTPRSAIRQDKRAEALKECIRMISAPGGCCTVFPFEAAIWLLEEQEELFGNRKPVHKSSSMSCTNLHRLVSRGSKHNLARGPSKNNLFAPPSLGRASSNLQSMGQQLKTPSPQQLNWYRGDSIRGVDREFIYKVLREEEDAAAARAVSSAVEKTQTQSLSKAEEFGRKLAHQFPWSPAAGVAVGLALRRRYQTHSGNPSTATHRKQIIKYLKHGIQRGANSAAGWKALAELQYQNRQFQDAYDTAVDGLEWSVKRRRAGHETLTSFALALRLVVAQCLRRLGRLDEAEYNFQVLAGWVTEGESAFNETSGTSSPLSIRQQALRGIAKCALERGDKPAARHQYERILGKSLIGQGPPAAHWAHSEYAWLLFEDGNLELAKQQLETALRSVQRESMMITDSEVADVHYKLGRICWTMGGVQLTDPSQARAHLEAATKEESEVQAVAFQWLGRWYEDVDMDYQKAQHCYERAIQIDDDDVIAAEALEKLKSQGKITLSPDHSSRLLDRIAAKKASARNQAKNSTAIGRIRYEGALERALS